MSLLSEVARSGMIVPLPTQRNLPCTCLVLYLRTCRSVWAGSVMSVEGD